MPQIIADEEVVVAENHSGFGGRLLARRRHRQERVTAPHHEALAVAIEAGKRSISSIALGGSSGPVLSQRRRISSAGVRSTSTGSFSLNAACCIIKQRIEANAEICDLEWS